MHVCIPSWALKQLDMNMEWKGKPLSHKEMKTQVYLEKEYWLSYTLLYFLN